MPPALRTHSEAQDGIGPRMSVTPSLRPPGRGSLIFNAKPNQMGVIKKSSTSLARRIFQTFEQFDHSLRQTADTAHKMITFRRYSDDKNRDDRDPCVKRLVDHYSFDAFFGLLVVSNAIFIGFEVEEGFVENRSSGVQVIQYSYTVLFLLELILRIAAYGRSFFCGSDWAWGWLDFLIVFSSMWEIGIDLVLITQEDDQLQGIGNSSALRAVRIIRITRMLKTLRLLRIFRFIVALRTLVTSIISTLKNLFWALMLLGIIIYAFAILFCQAIRTHLTDPAMPPLSEEVHDQAERFFGTLLDTMLSLFMSITNGVSWNLILIPLKEVHVVWVVFFLFFIAFTYLAVLNVVTGVFCQSAIESAQTDHALAVQNILANKEAHLSKIRELFISLAGEEDGVITYAMFEQQVHSPEVREYFETLGLDVWDAWSFFKMLDLDEGGCVEIDEFFMGCLRLRGAARAMDVCKIIHDQTWLLKTQSLFHSHMEEELKQLQQQILALSSKVSSINERPSRVPRESMAKPGNFDTSADEQLMMSHHDSDVSD